MRRQEGQLGLGVAAAEGAAVVSTPALVTAGDFAVAHPVASVACGEHSTAAIGEGGEARYNRSDHIRSYPSASDPILDAKPS
jgi:hypothetical protein